MRLASRHPRARPLFRWLPVPLWCYAVPMLAVAGGVLPAQTPVYRAVTTYVLPMALTLLLLSIDMRAIRRAGRAALLAMAAGMLGIVLGAVLTTLAYSARLPHEAWRGVGTLAATWTGGSLNMLAVQSVLDVPETLFAPLVVVDAVVAYGWMALLIGLSSRQAALDRWLGASPLAWGKMPSHTAASRSPTRRRREIALGLGLALGLMLFARFAAGLLPTGGVITSRSGWTILLVTTGALGCSLLPRIRRLSASLSPLGYGLLYLVLAALGARASLQAFLAAPLWLLVGVGIVGVHGIVLLIAGKAFRLPMALLATASQANLGGVVSGPLVAAVYEQRLVPVGLLLALAGNALGTYLGLMTATLCGWLMRT